MQIVSHCYIQCSPELYRVKIFLYWKLHVEDFVTCLLPFLHPTAAVHCICFIGSIIQILCSAMYMVQLLLELFDCWKFFVFSLLYILFLFILQHATKVDDSIKYCRTLTSLFDPLSCSSDLWAAHCWVSQGYNLKWMPWSWARTTTIIPHQGPRHLQSQRAILHLSRTVAIPLLLWLHPTSQSTLVFQEQYPFYGWLNN